MLDILLLLAAGLTLEVCLALSVAVRPDPVRAP